MSAFLWMAGPSTIVTKNGCPIIDENPKIGKLAITFETKSEFVFDLNSLDCAVDLNATVATCPLTISVIEGGSKIIDISPSPHGLDRISRTAWYVFNGVPTASNRITIESGSIAVVTAVLPYIGSAFGGETGIHIDQSYDVCNCICSGIPQPCGNALGIDLTVTTKVTVTNNSDFEVPLHGIGQYIQPRNSVTLPDFTMHVTPEFCVPGDGDQTISI